MTDKRTDNGKSGGALVAGEGGVFRGFDAGGGGDPDDGDEGAEAESEVRVVEGEGNRDEVGEERHPVFVLDGGVAGLELVGEAKAAGDGETQKHEAETGDDHRGGVKSDGEGVELFVEDVGGEEGQEREAEEEEEVGVEDGLVGLFGAVDEVVVVDPVNAGEGEGDGVDVEGGKDGVEAGGAVLVGDFEFEHHDGDDDGDDAVGEGFEAGWAGEVVGHECFWWWEQDTTRVAEARVCRYWCAG